MTHSVDKSLHRSIGKLGRGIEHPIAFPKKRKEGYRYADSENAHKDKHCNLYPTRRYARTICESGLYRTKNRLIMDNGLCAFRRDQDGIDSVLPSETSPELDLLAMTPDDVAIDSMSECRQPHKEHAFVYRSITQGIEQIVVELIR